MKNKFFKRAHISEAKFKLILKLFCEDKTAVEIAYLSGISRVTVNKYLGDIRTMIMTCEDQLLRKKSVRSKTGKIGAAQSRKLLPAPDAVTLAGLKLEGNTLTVHPMLKKIERSRVLRITKGKAMDEKEEAMAQRYCGFVDLQNRKFYHLRTVSRHKNGKEMKENADRFWSIFKNQIVKSKGLASNTIYLHLKESELRHNYGKSEMYAMLLKIMRQRTLHIDRAA
jgi:transposase